jgi:hypothetical protein
LTSKSRPERVPDSASKSVDRVFLQTGFVNDDNLAAIVFGDGEFLEEIRDVIGAANIAAVVAIGSYSAEGEDLLIIRLAVVLP